MLFNVIGVQCTDRAARVIEVTSQTTDEMVTRPHVCAHFEQSDGFNEAVM